MSSGTMNSSQFSGKSCSNSQSTEKPQNQKPAFLPAKDDTKPLLQDPILRSDPIETEEAVLRLPPLSISRSSSESKMA
ncbi:hypothetical protein L6164_000494 [Bauhinia variegata]|uniref:Uncharacterized protein n=1 Tax=Bauhinia variegata TaxID=167791 RepID=A0ACB9Q642_BAUVA|nr:hypothetical protein L6164_000494 [Bauhinia variegata]